MVVKTLRDETLKRFAFKSNFSQINRTSDPSLNSNVASFFERNNYDTDTALGNKSSAFRYQNESNDSNLKMPESPISTKKKNEGVKAKPAKKVLQSETTKLSVEKKPETESKPNKKITTNKSLKITQVNRAETPKKRKDSSILPKAPIAAKVKKNLKNPNDAKAASSISAKKNKENSEGKQTLIKLIKKTKITDEDKPVKNKKISQVLSEDKVNKVKPPKKVKTKGLDGKRNSSNMPSEVLNKLKITPLQNTTSEIDSKSSNVSPRLDDKKPEKKKRRKNKIAEDMLTLGEDSQNKMDEDLFALHKLSLSDRISIMKINRSKLERNKLHKKDLRAIESK